jgi:hypothetical protein
MFCPENRRKRAKSLTMILAHRSMSYLYALGWGNSSTIYLLYSIECIYHHIRIQQGDKMAEIVVSYRHVIESRIFALNIHPRHPMQNLVSYSLLNSCPFSFSHFSRRYSILVPVFI